MSKSNVCKMYTEKFPIHSIIEEAFKPLKSCYLKIFYLSKFTNFTLINTCFKNMWQKVTIFQSLNVSQLFHENVPILAKCPHFHKCPYFAKPVSILKMSCFKGL